MLLFANGDGFYKQRAWVIVDGDKPGKDALKKLRDDFSGWPEDRFSHWDAENFETYYPSRFASQTEVALNAPDKGQRRDLKKSLVEEVNSWIIANPELAKEELKVSAEPVIKRLRAVEASLTAST
jgi:hypothetical protein